MRTSTAATAPRVPFAAVLAAGAAVAAALLLANALTGSLLGSDDAVYAQVAREGLASGGSLLDPTWHHRPFLDKGPGLPLLLGASMAALGESELGLRLPGILAGLALLAGIFALGRRAGVSRASALLGAGFVLATNAFYFNARRPMTDMPAVALACWGLVALAGRDRSAARAAIAGALLGLSALFKLTTPASFLLAALALRRWRDLAVAAAVAVAVAAPWHLWMWTRHGDAFLDTYLLYHVFRRASSAVAGPGGPGVYLDWLAGRDGIAAVLLAVALLVAVVRRAGGLPLALAAASGLPLLAARTALPHYLVAALPAAGLLVATLAEAARDRSRLALPLLGIALAVSFAIANAADLAAPDYDPGARAACAAGLPVAAAYDLHDPAVDWYCGAEVPILADDPGLAAALADVPMLAGHVRPATPDAVAEAARAGAGVVTRPDRMDAFLALADRAGVSFEAREFAARTLVTLHAPARGDTGDTGTLTTSP